MATVVMNDILKVRIYTEVVSRSQLATSQLHYQVTAVQGAWTPKEVAEAIGQTHAMLWKPWLADTARYQGTGVKILYPFDHAAPEEISDWAAGPGAGGSALFPTQVTGLIGMKAGVYHTGSKTTKHPDGVQKVGSNRIFVSFPADRGTPEKDGRMSVYGRSLLQNIADTLFNSRGLAFTGGKTMTLFPKVRWRVKDTNPPAPQVVTYGNPATYYASDLWATQRRRGDRGQREASAF